MIAGGCVVSRGPAANGELRTQKWLCLFALKWLYQQTTFITIFRSRRLTLRRHELGALRADRPEKNVNLKAFTLAITWPVQLCALSLAVAGTAQFAQSNTETANSDAPDSVATAAVRAQTDSIVIADFTNKTGDTIFDDALKQGLTMELGQSPFLNVLSDREVGEALLQMGRATTEAITLKLRQDVCLRTGSKALIGGAITNLPGERYSLELTALACNTGDTLVTDQRDAVGKNGVLTALHQAASQLRMKLGESAVSVQKFDVPAAGATLSVEALSNYGAGIKVRREGGDTPAVPYLKRAIEIDPQFPLPYAELTAIYRNFRQPSAALEYAEKAYRLRDRVSEREKLKITGIYYLATGDLEKEIQNYELWQKQYPRDFQPYNNLGNDYAFTGQLEKSLPEYSQALKLMPSLISYVNVLGMQINLNRLDAAGATLNEAFANKLEGRYLRQNLYWLAFLRGDVAQMQQQIAWASGKPGDEDALLSMQSDTEAYFGRLAASRDFTRRAVDSAVQADSKEAAGLWQVKSALRMAEAGDKSLAREEVNSALALSTGRDVKLIAAFTLARAGDNSRAEALVHELKKEYATDFLMKFYWLPTINAAIELNAGNVSQALKDLETATPYELSVGTFVDCLYPAYVRGQVYLRAHQANAAAAEFQKLLDHPGIVTNFMTGALAHLQIARAYAAAGDIAKAKAAYLDFLRLWRRADDGILILEQAKSEYAKLPQQRSTPSTAEQGASAAGRGTLLTDKDSVVLGAFDNKTGEAIFDDVLRQTLAIELGQSPFLNVLSDKVSEAARDLGLSAIGHLTPPVSRNLCLRTGSKALIAGTILTSSGRYLLELTAVACRGGDTLAKARAEAENTEGVLKALNRVSSSVRTSLGESRASVQKFDVPVEASTHSLEAIKNYSIGITTRREQGDTPSTPFLKRAAELDPNFPLTYAELTATREHS